MSFAQRFGPLWHPDGVTFRLWAPGAGSVHLALEGAQKRSMPSEDGWYSVFIKGTKAGDRYRFHINDTLAVPDPASRFQPEDVNGPSELIDPDGFAWSDEEWHGRPWEEAVIYELHVGAFTPSGTYAGVEEKLDYLAALGVTAIELMPIADFAGKRGWGYDGVLPYAPDSTYGRPEELKHLINAAHRRGLMVFLDVVYNHFGPSGNYLHDYAAPFFTDKHQTPWGAAINYEGSRQVRDFFIGNALYWLKEFHFDGLRFDAVHAINDDSQHHILHELADTVRAGIANRHIHLMLENEKNGARYLGRNTQNAPAHYAAQWNDDIHHVFHVLLTGETGGYYMDYKDQAIERLGRALSEGFVYQGDPSPHRKGEKRGEVSAHLPPQAFIAFLQNHDQIGNRAMGERLNALAAEEKLTLASAILLLSPQPPLLFMGDEWCASTPFFYFCDFDGELADAVREGRRKEFAAFPEFSDEKARAKIPDPNAEQTFLASGLDWSETEKEPGHARLLFTRHMLEIRREHIVPLARTGFLKSRFQVLEGRGLEVLWQFQGGELQLFANTSEMELTYTKPEGTHLWGSLNDALPAWKCSWFVRRYE